MAKYEKQIKGNFEEIMSALHTNIMDRFSMNLVDESDMELGNVKIGVRVYDKFYFRNENRTSLSLTIVGDGEDLMISAIGSGGGSGILFNFSWGAEDDIVGIVESIVNGIERE
jgi:nucleoside-specific outer membrane channel protein Tsx